MSLTEDFLFIENKYKLNSIKIDGFTPWVYMRFGLWDSVMNPLRKLEKTKLEKIRFSIKSAFSILRILLMVRKNRVPKRVDICFLSHPRRVLIDNTYECIYTDALAEEFPDSVTLERLYNNFYRLSPVKTQNTLYLDKIEIRGYIHGAIAKYFRSSRFNYIKKQMKTLFSDALTELSVRTGIEFNSDKFAAQASLKYCFYKAKYKKYEKLLRKISPRLIIETCYYSTNVMAVNEIAKKIGIPTVELQHGIIHDDHIAYSFAQGERIPQFADKMFLFGEYWKSKAAYPLEDNDLMSVGFPYLEQQKMKYEKNKSGKVLLFISQPVISAHCEYDRLAADISARMCQKGWSVVFKLHPGEYGDWERRFPLLVDSNVKVISDNYPLYALFSEATAVVGLNSTALFEAVSYNLPIFIYDIFGAERMDDLCEAGYAVKFKDADELCNVLENLNDQDIQVKLEIWKSNALQNMAAEIQRFLEK